MSSVFECLLSPLQVLGELPEHCVFTLVYGLPIYWLAGLNEAPERFLLNFMLVWLIVYCSRAMALFVAAALPTLQTSAFMGNALFTVFYLTGGFVISLENMWLGEEMDQLSVVKIRRWSLWYLNLCMLTPQWPHGSLMPPSCIGALRACCRCSSEEKCTPSPSQISPSMSTAYMWVWQKHTITIKHVHIGSFRNKRVWLSSYKY